VQGVLWFILQGYHILGQKMPSFFKAILVHKFPKSQRPLIHTVISAEAGDNILYGSQWQSSELGILQVQQNAVTSLPQVMNTPRCLLSVASWCRP
jgi:hypothetical protein